MMSIKFLFLAIAFMAFVSASPTGDHDSEHGSDSDHGSDGAGETTGASGAGANGNGGVTQGNVGNKMQTTKAVKH
jgi:hypothetical protein